MARTSIRRPDSVNNLDLASPHGLDHRRWPHGEQAPPSGAGFRQHHRAIGLPPQCGASRDYSV